MNLFSAANFVTVCLLAYMCLQHQLGSAQLAENASIYYTPMRFDLTNRGSFNISRCMIDLTTCLEIVRADVMCQQGRTADTICPIMRDVCHDHYYDFDSYNFRFSLFESFCQSNHWQYWT